MLKNYTYQITSVNAEAKCMEVVYSAEGYESFTVGVRLPYDDETLENVISSYAPVPHWINSTRNYINPTPAAGTVGTIEID